VCSISANQFSVFLSLRCFYFWFTSFWLASAIYFRFPIVGSWFGLSSPHSGIPIGLSRLVLFPLVFALLFNAEIHAMGLVPLTLPKPDATLGSNVSMRHWPRPEG
jgi:hypothetical protein